MSYQITVVCRNGVVTLGEGGGDVPDGSWTIGGHEDSHSASINVVRRQPNGRFAAEAQHFSSNHNYDDSNFPQLGREDEIAGATTQTSEAPAKFTASSGVSLYDEPNMFRKHAPEAPDGVALWRNFDGGPEYSTKAAAWLGREKDLQLLRDIPQPNGELGADM